MIRKITHELAIAGQIDSTELQQLAEAGYRSILNLRSPTEKGFWVIEQLTVESFRLNYVNTPISILSDSSNLEGHIDPDSVFQIIQQIADLPKPLLLHCDSGMRASTLALTHIAMKQGMKLDQALQKIADMGLLPITSDSVP